MVKKIGDVTLREKLNECKERKHCAKCPLIVWCDNLPDVSETTLNKVINLKGV